MQGFRLAPAPRARRHSIYRHYSKAGRCIAPANAKAIIMPHMILWCRRHAIETLTAVMAPRLARKAMRKVRRGYAQ